MNEYQLRITGTAELGQAIDASKSLRIGVDLEVYSVEKLDLQNGDFTIRYKTKITSAIDVKQGDKIFKGRDKTKASQRLRWAIQAKADELGVDREEFYQKTMNEFIYKINL